MLFTFELSKNVMKEEHTPAYCTQVLAFKTPDILVTLYNPTYPLTRSVVSMQTRIHHIGLNYNYNNLLVG